MIASSWIFRAATWRPYMLRLQGTHPAMRFERQENVYMEMGRWVGNTLEVVRVVLPFSLLALVIVGRPGRVACPKCKRERATRRLPPVCRLPGAGSGWIEVEERSDFDPNVDLDRSAQPSSGTCTGLDLSLILPLPRPSISSSTTFKCAFLIFFKKVSRDPTCDPAC